MNATVAAEVRFEPGSALRGTSLLRVLDVLEHHPVRVRLRPQGPLLEADTVEALLSAAAAVHEAATAEDRYAVMRLTLYDPEGAEAAAQRLVRVRARHGASAGCSA